ncbi:septum formation initiator family protein [Saccharopolyspora erythraea]|uniref:FtsB family cell division protein n=1 Tax=Saccharopolyspora erythraea TaxID=1836 RepID=UPI001BAB5200|nr:septum formation initiator family protein [Saccharopolyspora erythraea]QUH00145.1 septum formation initiator family protein [Saccharopolyspora erythraea]
MSGRDRGQRRRRGESPAARRSERVRRNTPRSSGKRPGGQSPARSRPRSSSSGGAFKLSSTRHAAVLAIVVCAMALSVSVPLRTYLSQRAELAHQEQRKVELVQQVQELEQRRTELSDPARIEAEARARLGYVRPGETPYVVEVPAAPQAPAPAAEPRGDGRPWYERLWDSVTGKEQ